MQQAAIALWKKSKKQYNRNPSKCNIHGALFVVTATLLWVQVVLYQSIHQHQQGHGSFSSLPHKVDDASSLRRAEAPRSLQTMGANNNDIAEKQRNHVALVDEKDSNTNNKQTIKFNTDVSLSSSLPDWIRNYVAWHKRMRQQFPGKHLFDDPNAPKLLVRTCLGLCGGINDRLGQLPWDLYLANQTNRVLLMHWHRPVSLEHFLIPAGDLDWRVPTDVQGFFPAKHERTISREGLQVVRQGIRDMFEGYSSANPTIDFWTNDFPVALQRAQTGALSSEKVLRHRLLGHLHETILEDRLRDLGETDMIHGTATFGNIFHLFFQLAPPIQQELDAIYRSLGLQAGAYSAVHCRVRHPKAVVGLVKGKNENFPADKTGLPWEGETRQNAINTAVRALRCAQTLQTNDQSHDPIYFFSDSNDLVRYMSRELYNATFVQEHKEQFTTSAIETNALGVSHGVKILARPCDEENAHIDRQKGRAKEDYYGTFIDLFLAINARCVTYGIGFYAVFATKISHVSCKLLYQEEAWGGSERKRQHVPLCQLEDAAFNA